MKIWHLILIYLIGFNLTWPALLADAQHRQHRHYSGEFACKDFRSDLGAAMVFSIAPPMWIAAPFVTGFYEYGFMVSKPEYCVKNESI